MRYGETSEITVCRPFLERVNDRSMFRTQNKFGTSRGSVHPDRE